MKSLVDKILTDLFGEDPPDWLEMTSEEATGALRLLLDETENNPTYELAFRSIWQGAATVIRRFEAEDRISELENELAAARAVVPADGYQPYNDQKPYDDLTDLKDVEDAS